MWNPIYEAYGVIRVERDKVRVHKDQYNYATVFVGEPITNALWANGVLHVYLANGMVRRYFDPANYATIY